MATNSEDGSLCSKKEAIGKKPWPNLPPQLLYSIAWQPNLVHNISYPGTTKSWRATSRRCNNNGKLKWLQILDTGVVNYCDLSQTFPRFVNIFFREYLPGSSYWPGGCYWSPVPHIRNTTRPHYVGFSQCTVVARGTNPSEFYILDAFSRVYSMLPYWDVDIPFRFLVLSTPALRGSYDPKTWVMVLTGISKPAFAVCRRGGGDKYAWVRHDSTIIDPHDPEQKLIKFTSAIAFEGKFYALSLQGTLAVIEDMNSQLTITAISKTRAVPSIKARHFKECLLESNGEILLIFLIYQKSITVADQVEVFRLNFPKLTWVKMESLGERTLFVEPECCIWVKASDVWCRSNCLYFTQGDVDGWWIYDLKAHSISPMEQASIIRWSTPRENPT